MHRLHGEPAGDRELMLAPSAPGWEVQSEPEDGGEPQRKAMLRFSSVILLSFQTVALSPTECPPASLSKEVRQVSKAEFLFPCREAPRDMPDSSLSTSFWSCSVVVADSEVRRCLKLIISAVMLWTASSILALT